MCLQEWNITQLTFEEDPEPYGKERDHAICALAAEFGVQVVIRSSHTLYDLRQWVLGVIFTRKYCLLNGQSGMYFGVGHWSLPDKNLA